MIDLIRPLRPWQVLAVGAALVLPAIALAGSWATGQEGGSLATVAVLFVPVGLLAAFARPDLFTAGLAGLVVANAGLVLSDGFGVPNVVRVGTLLALAGLLLVPSHREAALRWTPVLVAFLIFAEVRVLSALAAPGEGDAIEAAKDLAYGGLLILALSALGASAGALRRALQVTVGVATLLVGLATLRVVGLGGTFAGFAPDVLLTPEERDAALRSLEPQGDTFRAAGPMADPNYWAQTLVLLLPLALWLARTGSTRTARLAWGASAAVIAAGVFETNSRGGLVSLGIVLTAWLWLQGGRWRSAIPALALVAAVGILAAPGTFERVRSLSGLANPAQADDPALRGRYSEAVAAVHMFRDYPLLGIGTGQYPLNYRAYAAEIGIDARPEREPHSSYLEMAAESGLAGLVAFVGMLVAALWSGLHARGLLRERDPVSSGAAAALVAGLLGYSVAALFLHQAFPDYLWLALGLLSAVYIVGRNRSAAAGAGL